MISESEHNEFKENDFIKAITEQPLKSLENKINNIQNDIKTRQKLSDKILSQLHTQKIRLEDRFNRTNYQTSLTGNSTPETETSNKLFNLQDNINKEELSCFNDISNFKDKLQETKDEFETEKLSHKLL